MTADDMRQTLERLEAERRLAAVSPLHDNATYMDDLETDLEAARDAYVALAVTEIASLRAQLSGPQTG